MRVRYFELIQQRRKSGFKDSLMVVTHLNQTNLISYWEEKLNLVNLFVNLFFYFLFK